MSNKELPLQKVVPEEFIEGIEGVFFVTEIGDEAAEHPKLLVTETVNVPELVALMLCVVAPDDHK